MADRCQATITIGGTLPAALLPVFVELIQNEGLATEWDGVAFAALDLPKDDALRLMANEVSWGCFSTLEAFCVEHGLPFARWSGCCLGSWDAERTVFTGHGDAKSYGASDDDYVLIGRHTAQRSALTRRLSPTSMRRISRCHRSRSSADPAPIGLGGAARPWARHAFLD